METSLVKKIGKLLSNIYDTHIPSAQDVKTNMSSLILNRELFFKQIIALFFLHGSVKKGVNNKIRLENYTARIRTATYWNNPQRLTKT